MAIVQIFTGAPDLLSKGQFDCSALKVEDYLPVYKRIVQSIYSRTPLRVAVLDRVVSFWLKKLADRYGKESVSFEELTLRGQLGRQWGVMIPEWVREQDLDHPTISGMSISAPPGFSFEDFLVSVFFSPFLARPSFAAQLLGELIRTYNEEQWISSTKIGLLQNLLMKRFQQWKENARLDGEKVLIRWLEESPTALIDKLGLMRVVAGYPEGLGLRVFGDDYPVLGALDLDYPSFPVRDLRRSKIDELVRVYLEDLFTLDPAVGLVRLLDEASGCLDTEFDAFRRLLPKGGSAVSEDMIRRARQIFGPISRNPRVQQGLADLDLMIAQIPPEAPDSTWDEDQWIDWAVNRYLPYRYWLENTGQLDDQIGDIADQYAQWFFSHYSNLRLNSPRMAWRAIPQTIDRMKQSSGPVLFIVLDNFNTKYLNDLQGFMQSEGFFLDQLDFRFSLIPSCTEVCKPSLLGGDPRPPAGTYNQIVESTWSARIGKKMLYLPHIGALRNVTLREHDVYFLNYLPPDLSLHQDEQQTGISHSQAIRSYMAALSLDIRSFADRIGAERDLLVIMTADHGSTIIPGNTPNVIDGKFYRDKIIDLHHRYIKITDAELKKLPANVSGECFTLTRELYELPENYLVAQRLFRFGSTTDSVAVHGGVTPEETIVPLAIFTPVTITPKPLVIRLIDKSLRAGGALNQLTFEITNTNTYVVEQVAVELLHPGLDVKELIVPSAAKLSTTKHVIQARFKRPRSGEAEIMVQMRLRYTFLGQPQEQVLEFPVQIQMTMRTSMDDFLQ